MNFSANAGRQKNNTTGLAVVVLLHLILAVLMLQGSRITLPHAPPVVDAILLAQPLPPPPPEPADPDMSKVTPRLPPVYVPISEAPPIDAPAPVISTTNVNSDVPLQVDPPADAGSGEAGGAPVARAEPVRVAPKVAASACAKPAYPAASQRNGDTGTVTLALLVGTDGRVADARVERSSGFRELDRAARTGLSLCRFTPGTVDGVPYQSWTKMQYVWSLD